MKSGVHVYIRLQYDPVVLFCDIIQSYQVQKRNEVCGNATKDCDCQVANLLSTFSMTPFQTPGDFSFAPKGRPRKLVGNEFEFRDLDITS